MRRFALSLTAVACCTALVVPSHGVDAAGTTTPKWRVVAKLGSSKLSPKSVVASSRGQVIAQNMMYTHGVTVFSAAGAEITRISDSVSATMLGRTSGAQIQGAPVEAAFSPDGKFAYVSNYQMTGPGFGKPGFDKCAESTTFDNSFLYKIDMDSYKIIGAARVGEVPKYVAVTPNNKYALVSNWCSFSLSVVDLATFKEVRQIDIGRYPRGIAVTRDSSKAYVTVMGAGKIATVDLATFAVKYRKTAANTPRHIVLSPDEQTMYVTHNLSSIVIAYEVATGRALRRVVTGTEPRSMVISPDGTQLFVVNNASNTMSIVDATTFKVVQRMPTPYHPIGITYEPTLNRVWVACYNGQIRVYARS